MDIAETEINVKYNFVCETYLNLSKFNLTILSIIKSWETFFVAYSKKANMSNLKCITILLTRMKFVLLTSS